VIVLGLAGAHDHDPSAAIIVDGDVAAALEEERLSRETHARGQLPIESARYCLDAAGVGAKEIDVVAFPSAPVAFGGPARRHYARRHAHAPHLALAALLDGSRNFRHVRARVREASDALGIDWRRTELVPVEHALAHASSAYHFAGFAGKTAIATFDGGSDHATASFAIGDAGRIATFAALYSPDSIAGLYGSMTEYLGFAKLDGEERASEMAARGDAARVDLSRLVARRGAGSFEIDTRYVNAAGSRRWQQGGAAFSFGRELVSRLGPRRDGNRATAADFDCAAALQRLYEDVCLELIDHHLGATLRETGQLVLAGGGALNAQLNRRILARDDVRRLFVPPAPGDAGTALGAAAHVAAARGDRPKPMRHVYLGPGFSTAQCIEVLEVRSERPRWRRLADVADEAAQIITAGHPLAWFQGRMELGPRALGARSVLGDPNAPGITERIAGQLGIRDRWRPIGASALERLAPELTGSAHASPFMSATFDVAERWRGRISECVRSDGSVRLHTVTREVSPRYYALLEALERRTGKGVVLNVPLCRDREPIVCSPADALHLFYGSSLQYLVLEDLLVTKA